MLQKPVQRSGIIGLLAWHCSLFFLSNGPFPSSLVPLFQNKSSCKTFHMKTSLICMKEDLKVYMTYIFLFARLNLPNMLISIAKKIFDSDFPSPCFDVPKSSNFTSGGVQTRDTKNRRLGTIVTSIQDSKPREKQISQSFSYCELINLLRNDTIVRCL